MQAIQQEFKPSASEDIQVQPLGDSIPKRVCGKIKSQDLSSYNSYLGAYQPPPPDCFRKNKIYHQEQPIYPDAKEVFQLFKETQLNQAEIVRYRVTLSQFQLKVFLLNVKGANPFLRHPLFRRGNYGKIYFYRYLEKTIAVKVFTYPDQLHSFSSIKTAIKQYAIMKICSALRCGPNIESNFGFDLVAYDDSVMFCMQKCVPIHRFIEEHSTALRLSLRLMHKFKIIHFDVKPDNVLYSPHFRKAVFIDFGLSEVILEALGFKTFVDFRGSPGFCSEEMSLLLGGHSVQNYVDAYHNDMHGLQKTLWEFQPVIDSQGVQQLDSESSEERFDLEDEEIGNQLLLILLKFAFMVKQKDVIVTLLRQKECFLLKEYGSLVLNNSRIYLEHKTFELIYRELRRQFHDFVDQALIENYFKFHFRDQLYQDCMLGKESIENNNAVDFTARIVAHDLLVQTIPFQKYRQFLEIPNVFINESTAQRSKSFLIQCLKFDKKYFSKSDKISLSNKFNQTFGIQSEQNLESIQFTFLHLFEYCIKEPITHWKKNNIFLVLNQAFMIDLNIEHHLDRLILCLVKMHPSFKDMVDCWMQIYKITLMQSFKHISDHECMKQMILYKLYTFGSQLLFKGLKLYENSEQKETRHIIAALKIYLQLKAPSKIKDDFYRILNELKMIEYGRFQKELIQLIYLEMLELCYGEQTYEQISQFQEIIKNFHFSQILQENSTTFHYSVYYLYHIFVITKNNRQITRLFKNISNIINCPQVYSRYKFQMCIFLFSDERNPRKLYEFASQILKSPNSLQTVRFRWEFQQLIQRIQKDPHLLSSFPEIIEQIIKVFTKLNEGNKGQGKVITTSKIQNIMYRYNMLNYFLRLRPSMCKEYLQQILQSFEQKKLNSNEATMTSSQFLNYNLYLSIDHDIMGFPLKKLKAFENIYRISAKMRNQKLILYSLKNIIKIALFQDVKDKLLHYTLIFYNFSHEVPSYARFFQAGRNHLITVTLYQLQSCQRLDEFYFFLMMLAKFVTRYPSKKVILEWSDNIGRLMKEKNFLQLMRYEELSTKINDIFWDNHYYVCYYIYSLQIQPNKAIIFKIFAKIAQNINFLTTHAKEIVLPTFFKFIIFYFQSKKRKFVYLTLRWGYKYLKKNQFLNNLKISSLKIDKPEKSSCHYHPKSILRQKILANLGARKTNDASFKINKTQNNN